MRLKWTFVTLTKTWRVIYLKMWCKYIFFKYSVQYVSWRKKFNCLVFQELQAEVVHAWYHGYDQPSSIAYILKYTVFIEMHLSILGSVKKEKMNFEKKMNSFNTIIFTSLCLIFLFHFFPVLAPIFYDFFTACENVSFKKSKI